MIEIVQTERIISSICGLIHDPGKEMYKYDGMVLPCRDLVGLLLMYHIMWGIPELFEDQQTGGDRWCHDKRQTGGDVVTRGITTACQGRQQVTTPENERGVTIGGITKRDWSVIWPFYGQILSPLYVDFSQIHVSHQWWVTTSQKYQRQLSPSTTYHTTHNQQPTKKDNSTMIPQSSPASSRSNF